LQERGVGAWLDVHRLEPGTDWDQAIMDALHHSSALVLVASRASRASVHVEAEWRAAKDAGMPIHVVLVEAVTLPSELAGSAVHDLRIDVDEGVGVLAQVILGRVAPASRPYRQARTSIGFLSPIKRPPVVSFTWIALLGTTLISLLLGAAVLAGVLTWDHDVVRSNLRADRPRVLAWVAGWAGFTVVAAYFWWSFARRRFRLPVLVGWLVFAPLILGLLEVGAEDLFDYLRHGDVTVVVEDSASDYLSGPFAVSLLVLVVLSWRMAFVVQRSENMARWLPTGEVSEATRTQRTVAQRPVREPSSPASARASRIYSLHSDGAADDQLAAAVEAAMAAAGHARTDEPDDAGDHIVVVSSDTGREWLEQRFHSLRGPRGLRDRHRNSHAGQGRAAQRSAVVRLPRSLAAEAGGAGRVLLGTCARNRAAAQHRPGAARQTVDARPGPVPLALLLPDRGGSGR
jgi:hypothetical protein